MVANTSTKSICDMFVGKTTTFVSKGLLLYPEEQPSNPLEKLVEYWHDQKVGPEISGKYVFGEFAQTLVFGKNPQSPRRNQPPPRVRRRGDERPVKMEEELSVKELLEQKHILLVKHGHGFGNAQQKLGYMEQHSELWLRKYFVINGQRLVRRQELNPHSRPRSAYLPRDDLLHLGADRYEVLVPGFTGIIYRRTKQMDDTSHEAVPNFAVVRGQDEGDGWVYITIEETDCRLCRGSSKINFGRGLGEEQCPMCHENGKEHPMFSHDATLSVADALKEHDRTHTGVISHGWLAKDHPDPLCKRRNDLKAVGRTYLFWDFLSLMQLPRSASEESSFRKALGSMHLVYGHGKWCVFRLLTVPDKAESSTPYLRRGWCFFETGVSSVAARAVQTIQNGKQIFDERSIVPMNPTRFAEELRKLEFRWTDEGGDRQMISQLYRAMWPHLAQATILVAYAWDDIDVDKLIQVLPELKGLKTVWIRNSSGDCRAKISRQARAKLQRELRARGGDLDYQGEEMTEQEWIEWERAHPEAARSHELSEKVLATLVEERQWGELKQQCRLCAMQ